MNFSASLVAISLLATAPSASEPLTVEGFLEPYHQIDLAPAEPGTVAELQVEEGEPVKPGQLLGTLDCEVLLISLAIAEQSRDARGRLDAARAERDIKQARLSSLLALQQRAHASTQEVQRARADLEIAQANLLMAEEQRQIAELECKKVEAMLERRRLRSPIDGIVARIYREETEYVTSAEPTVLTVVQLNPLRVVFSVPTAQSQRLSPDAVVPLLLPESGLRLDGRVEYVAPITDADSGTVRVKVLIDNSENLYRAGVRALLLLDEAQESDNLAAR